ncbi:Holliday junction branch migration protein RuvA [Paenibacillus sambharensis]|uniref:Holliday junction branch migration complex subunit RuvA n=1 Tax=Paenibacillus sambharensis TaxID=1803190 RepID=A0A2W1L5D6_9BACL|nr:Holliday junction branch migration protein RuvA [Paenibacillus sambharensis]PZD94143.1 Holliday junction branch migration protein RuvA [Paenibacillus sambharensis]
MIDFVRGMVAHIEPEYIVVDVHDTGYRVFTPNPYAFSAKEEKVTVYTHHHVREDAILLFGFATREEQQFFRKLLEVSGIGPRVALGVLAAGTPDTVVAAIRQENLAFLTKLPGIGKKTAQRMILDLKDKLAAHPMDASELSSYEMPSAAASGAGSAAWQEAREALTALGYTASELDKAWAELEPSVSSDESVDALMKRALQQLFKG